MSQKTLKERHSQLKPIMKYLYFQKLDECHAKADLLDKFMTDLEKAGKLVDFMLDTRRFSKPHEMYHHLRTIYKPAEKVVHLTYAAFHIAEEMAARCCYLYKKKGKLSDLKLVSLTQVPGKEKMKPWIKLFEREDLREIDTKTAHKEWMTTTDSGKKYAQKREFYIYAISNLMRDTNLNSRIVIKKKLFPNTSTPPKEQQRT